MKEVVFSLDFLAEFIASLRLYLIDYMNLAKYAQLI